MSITFDLDGVLSELARIYGEYVAHYPNDERFRFLGSFYADQGEVDALIEANEWLRYKYAPDLSPEVFSSPAARKGEHSPFTIALGVLLRDIQQELSSKGIL
jgi:hypothetical protein